MKWTLPGPTGALDTLRRFNADPIGFLREAHAEHGDTFGMRILHERVVSTISADAIAAVLRNTDRVYIKDEFTRELRRLLGDGLLVTEGDLWRSRRKQVAPPLRRGDIPRYGQIFVDHARRWLDTLEPSIDLQYALTRLTLGIVAEALFAAPDVDTVDEMDSLIGQAMVAHVQHERTWRRVLPAWLPGSPRWTSRRLAGRLTAIVDRLIADRKHRPAGDDLLWRLLEARDDDGNGLDDRGLRDESVTLFVAGHETTTLALTFALSLLGRHPAALERVEAEIDTVLGDRPATADDMAALVYTAAVVKESMRLHPPAWTIGRETTAAVEVDGHTVPAGSLILIPISTVHTDPRRFPEPDAFKPERWIDGPAPGRWDYLPFGGGARICVGNHFALMESVLVLATLIQGARFELVDPRPLTVFASVTQRPARPVRVRVEPRNRPLETS